MNTSVIVLLVAAAAPAAQDAACRLGDKACAVQCDAGDDHACFVWGTMLLEGVGVPRDVGAADAMFVRGCKKDDAESCNAHGVYVRERAITGDRDWDSVFALFERACSGGSSKGCTNAAEILRDRAVAGHAAAERPALLRKACEIDDPASGAGCYAYGEALKTGKGVAKDDVLAGKWLARACRAGVSQACGEAADLGVKVDITVELLQKIDERKCDGDDAKACARVGSRILHSRSASAARAVSPLSMACVGGEAKACADLGQAMLFGKVPGASEDALALLDKACALDDAASCRRVGDALLVGHFAVRDEAHAKEMMKKGCNLGDERACTHASAYQLGKGGKRTIENIVSLVFSKDCKGGDHEACVELKGLDKPMHAAAPGTQKIAANDTERACENDADARACYEAGSTYAGKGKGVDHEKARYFFDLGCKAGYPRACTEAGKAFSARGQDPILAVDAYARGCFLGNNDACDGAARMAKRVGGEALARAKPVLERACSAKVASACDRF